VTVLLDSSVVIALLADEHEHHQPARHWFAQLPDAYATCPITQGSLIRYALRIGRTAAGAQRALMSLVRRDQHEFWPDELDYLQVGFDGVTGHRQVTDSYLAQLARHHTGRVATLDHGFAALHADVVDLVPIDA
jgi:toxin-antitoxin system PIN domain toxin